MRAAAKILRARASEHPCNFCEQFEQRPNFASTFKLNETILHPSKSPISLDPCSYAKKYRFSVDCKVGHDRIVSAGLLYRPK